ncbi:hypothetical protein [Angustibacter sp. Root456]|uniref:hypothetical protein n=1 Tax=Angustibacter sp. Root456 TaxID=1736539 RepID=UPI0006FE13BB|nr:hypothetical protein [Angustibacter sp. Root456]KQX66046.1 hypothetical protein ASD06_06525 [Angustibacter sp. Root456]
MLSSISPLGERARRARWGLTVSAYLVGSAVGGLAVGAVSAALGGLLPAAWRASGPAAAVVVLLLLVGLGLDVRARGGALPSWRRQVDEAWLARYRGWVYGLGFGLQLGAGVLTIVTSSTVYAMLALAAWSGTPAVGAALGATFGLARALPVLAVRRVHAPGELRAVFARVERLGRPVDVVSRGALVLVAAAAAGTVWS